MCVCIPYTNVHSNVLSLTACNIIMSTYRPWFKGPLALALATNLVWPKTGSQYPDTKPSHSQATGLSGGVFARQELTSVAAALSRLSGARVATRSGL